MHRGAGAFDGRRRGKSLHRPDLCEEAIDLGRLIERLIPVRAGNSAVAGQAGTSVIVDESVTAGGPGGLSRSSVR
jgi:hypothetical protein